ncbi:Cytochrome P450 CYP4/CYP19/CYP26 subfamily [Handroanthus impetiginosus]|uniref:Cytochrome P450 CYP4/CYP19/CYP26 subfamily n=1 Tax=Handroanthus impetiginosus TaxID=429701 RepID=A0A2G9GIC9_9LAMI|nr:Cytochrome P450 CYP4/CYP19/CYP26 subfamily [Handroanthus impetiginosus]
MWKFALVPVLAILVFWTWQFFYWVWLKPRKIERLLRKQGMKGSPYRFLFGDSKDTSRMYDEAYSKPIGINDDITPRVMPNILHTLEKYGNYSFSWSGPRPRIFINDPAVAREVLNNRHLYVKTFKISNHTVKLLATGIANLEGDEWAKSRSRIGPHFLLDRLKPMVPAIQLCCEDTLNGWKEMVTKEGGSCVIDVFPHLEIFTGAVLAQLMFSSTYTEDLKKTFLQLAELAVLARLPSKIFTMPGEQYLPTQTNRRSKEIDKYVRVAFTSMINERLKRNKVAPTGNLDLLDTFMAELYDGKVRTETEHKAIMEDAIAECKIFFFAGFETSSNILSWTLIVLGIHQEWQGRAREEVFQVLGNKKDITSDDLRKLKIITMIINEMLRLYPPVMELSRVVEEDTKINGYNIPKDSIVTLPNLIFHRNPEIWGEDAGEFRPDRFAEGVLKATKGESAYMPFGGGPRICIGMNFAMLEIKTFLAVLLRNFSFEISPTYTHAPFVAFTIQPQYGAPIVLKKL